jgi:hypothetical protein
VLALYSSADLPLLDRWRIRRHLAHCELCDRQFGIFRASTVELKRLAGAETLTGFEAVADWSRLERETGGLLVKFAAAAGMFLLFVLGWSTHVPAEQTSRVYVAMRNALSGNRTHEYQGPVLRSLPDGIVVGSQETSLTILHPGGAVVSASGPSSVEARYSDDETGQVTITNVYGQ